MFVTLKRAVSLLAQDTLIAAPFCVVLRTKHVNLVYSALSVFLLVLSWSFPAVVLVSLCSVFQRCFLCIILSHY